MARLPDPRVGDGLLIVDKERGWTSHDVVGRVRRIAGTRKVGHAGTLDPMATGVLVVGVNRATRLLTYLVGCDKTYEATIRLGQATVTDDAEGEVTVSTGAHGVTDESIETALLGLRGRISQVPSAVSAIKVAGQRSYARVRAGEDVQLAARDVDVHELVLLDVRRTRAGDVDVVDLDVRVTVSAGTYVRALARDLGARLGCGGHLTALRRTRVGAFEVSRASTLAQLEAVRERDDDLPLISPARAAAAVMPVRPLDADEADAMSHGRAIPGVGGTPSGLVALTDPDGVLIAVADDDGSNVRPRVVFPRDPSEVRT